MKFFHTIVSFRVSFLHTICLQKAAAAVHFKFSVAYWRWKNRIKLTHLNMITLQLIYFDHIQMRINPSFS